MLNNVPTYERNNVKIAGAYFAADHGAIRALSENGLDPAKIDAVKGLARMALEQGICPDSGLRDFYCIRIAGVLPRLSRREKRIAWDLFRAYWLADNAQR